MNSLIIKQSTQLSETNVPASVINKLSELDGLNVDMELEGNISINGGVYLLDIDLLNTKYPDLNISASKYYIKFEDSAVGTAVINYMYPTYCDGIGITAAQASAVPDNQFLRGNDHCTFKNTSITSFNELVYFDKVETIQGDVFKQCSLLTSVDLTNVKYIRDGNSFESCSNLSNLGNFIPVQLGYPGSLNVGNYFSGCSKLESINLSAVEVLANNVFYGCTSLKYISGGSQNFTLSSLNRIGEATFRNCNIQDLIELNCPSLEGSVSGQTKTLKVGAFMDIKSLVRITNLGSITKIDDSQNWCGAAFQGCTNLEEVTLPATMTYIGKGAFKNCNNITKLTCLATTPPSINTTDGFIPATAQIYVPAASVSAYQSATGWSNYTINAIS